MNDETCWRAFGNTELRVPSDMGETYGPGPWDHHAEYYGPILAKLNPYVEWLDLVYELDNEYGLDKREWNRETAWEYAAWFIAGDLHDEGVTS